MKMHVMYHSEDNSGYGRFGSRTVRALTDLGVENAGDLGLRPGDMGDRPLASVALWLSTPPHVRGWFSGQLGTIFTMWESTEMPAGFRENLHHFDRIFVPSEQNRELFSRFHPDVRMVPLAVDESWHYRPAPMVERDFRFLSCGFGPRKGCRMVADAFLKVFPGAKPGYPGGPWPKLTLRSGDDIVGPGITTIPSYLSAKGELNLYEDAHCYVSGSKGEGWGFMPLQAITMGRPTILGNAHGHAAYAHYGIGLDTHPYTCKGATFWGDGGEWWEPDFDQMCEAMWDVYNDYHKHATIAMTRAFRAAAEFTWQFTAERLIFNLPELFEEPPAERVWKFAPPRLFHIRVNKRCTFTINGKAFHFEPGVDYYEAADLKRQMIANGHLDWSSFDPHDVGLEDNPDIPRLRAHNSMCPTCNQPYNRAETIAELVGA